MINFQICDSEIDSGSETEEMELQNDEDEEEDEEVIEDETDSNEKEDNNVETVDNNVSDSFLPEETLDRKESVEIWKSRNETDVIGKKEINSSS